MSTNAKVTAFCGFLTSLKLCRDAQQSCQTQQWALFRAIIMDDIAGESYLKQVNMGKLLFSKSQKA